jgi:hypothetical protein
MVIEGLRFDFVTRPAEVFIPEERAGVTEEVWSSALVRGSSGRPASRALRPRPQITVLPAPGYSSSEPATRSSARRGFGRSMGLQPERSGVDHVLVRSSRGGVTRPRMLLVGIRG